MSIADITEEQRIRPYLLISAFFFFAYTAIIIHDIVVEIIYLTNYTTRLIPFYEQIIGMICLILGLASIILILQKIKVVNENCKKYINTTMIILGVFIVYSILIYSYPYFIVFGFWREAALIIIYGLLRGIALRVTNIVLNHPEPGYGSKIIEVYGWSYIIGIVFFTMFSYIGIIGKFLWFIAALVIIVILAFIELFSVLFIGVRFIQYAINQPVITPTEIKLLISLPVPAKPVTTSQTTDTPIATKTFQTETAECELKRKTIPKEITLKEKIARVRHLIQSRSDAEIEIDYLKIATGLSSDEIIKITKEFLGFEIDGGKIIGKKIS